MRMIDATTIEQVTGAKVVSRIHTQMNGIGTDTRADLTGQLFIALKGESFDAHQFLHQAIKQNAAAVLIHSNLDDVQEYSDRVSIFVVPDTLKALQQLGTWSRRQSRAKVLAMTGSNGKTTTKEFAAAMIGSCRSVHYSKGSFNNHWGVPFTLLQLPESVDVAIVEMGMNHAGEITELVRIAEPDAVVCTMVGKAHIEHFGTIEKIAQAKEEIYLAAKSHARKIYNLDNDLTLKMYEQELTKNQIGMQSPIIFSEKNPKAHVYLQIKELDMHHMTLTGRIDGVQGTVRVNVFGQQNLTNLQAAAALALAAGLSAEEIWHGLQFCRTNWGRNQLVQVKSGAHVIFDAYNANPDSMAALIRNIPLLKCDGKKIGVFGEMLEMGPQSGKFHFELGQQAGQAGFDLVYFLGLHAADFARGLASVDYNGLSVVDQEFKHSSVEELKRELQAGDIAVMKGSRGMKMERYLLACDPIDFENK